MKTINELQDEVIEEFSDFDDWMDKYQLLIDLGNEQEPLDPQYKTEQNLNGADLNEASAGSEAKGPFVHGTERNQQTQRQCANQRHQEQLERDNKAFVQGRNDSRKHKLLQRRFLHD